MNIAVFAGFPRPLPLAACLAAAFALTHSQGHAAPASISRSVATNPRSPQDVVTNCDDSGPGSLRRTIANAVSGDTIDLTQLTCSTITLTSGVLQIHQDDLTLAGPGALLLAISGDGTQQVLQHLGYGSLVIDGLTIAHGYFSDRSAAGGGCIYVRTSLTVSNSIVSNCEAYDTISAYGGAIFALNDLTIENSVITGNRVRAAHVASGGGLQVLGNLVVEYSTISGNRVITSNGAYEYGGGAHTFSDVTIRHSTINANSGRSIGGLFFEAFLDNNTATIVDSTVSGNFSNDDGPFGGIWTTVPLSIYNSTIAFNTGVSSGGVYAMQVPLTLQSTIIADNVSTDVKLSGSATVDGANNLIEVADDVPADTIRDDPQLAPLHANGGPTVTHKLSATSPAIDTGSNPLGLDTDQRGTGFARVSGAAPDIGAYESTIAADTIFANGFDP
jgi:hypothetical protein